MKNQTVDSEIKFTHFLVAIFFSFLLTIQASAQKKIIRKPRFLSPHNRVSRCLPIVAFQLFEPLEHPMKTILPS